MPGKERKRKRGIETAAHNCVEIEGSLCVITHMTGFRLDHKWNRTTMGDLRVTIILHAILCILSLHHNRRPNPAICLFQSLIILCQIKLSR